MIVKVRTYKADGFQQDGASMPVTFLEAVVVPDNPDDEAKLMLGRLFFSDDLMERFCSVITLELEENYVRNFD